MAAEPVVQRDPARGRSLPLSQLVTLSIYWLGIQTIWGGLNTVVLPDRFDELGPAVAGSQLAVTLGIAAVAAILVQPTVGIISDYTVTRWGRRKPYIVIGTLLDMAFLLGLATANEFWSIVALYFLLQVSSNFAQGPFQGYVPDLVPAHQVGLASGLMGLMLTLGTIAGVGLATIGPGFIGEPAAVVSLGLVEGLTMAVLVLTVNEGRAAPRRTTSWFRVAASAWARDILAERDVLWLLVVRLLFLGAYNATLVALLFFQRSLGLPEEGARSTLFLAVAIVAVLTALAALPGGRLSDRFGRRAVIWGACALASLGLVGAALAPTRELAIAAWVPFGIGVGAFLSADWALMSDVIPKHTAGRYMGILNAGTAMAGPVYIVIAGPAQDLTGALFGAPVGPRVAIAIAAAFVVGAGLALTRVDPRRREDPLPAPEPVVQAA
ncbi:MAG TPA: MFS transporter [candidate division Zixibacteria bacterium]|nr:MFS transporter [candidate division Zixibacteria bacterium]